MRQLSSLTFFILAPFVRSGRDKEESRSRVEVSAGKSGRGSANFISVEDALDDNHLVGAGGAHVQEFSANIKQMVKEMGEKIDTALAGSANKAIQESKKYKATVEDLMQNLNGFSAGTQALKDAISDKHGSNVQKMQESIEKSVEAHMQDSEVDSSSSLVDLAPVPMVMPMQQVNPMMAYPMMQTVPQVASGPPPSSVGEMLPLTVNTQEDSLFGPDNGM